MLNKTLEKWEEKTINDVCIVERGSSPRPIKDFITTDNNGVNWIKIGDCSGKYVTNTAQKITQEGAKKSRYVKVGDFIISNSMSYGKPYILKIDGYIHDGWFVLRLNNDLVNTDYFYYLLSSNYIREQYDALATGAIVQNISSDLIKKVTFKLPPLQEQQRIVGILDKAFANIEKAKQNALQNLNNAKELFETTRHELFAKNSNNWQIKKMSEIAINLDSKRIPITKNLRDSGDIPYYGASGVVDYVKDYIFDDNLLLISEDGANLLMRTYPIAFSILGKTWVNNHAHVLKFNDLTTQKLVEYYLNSINLEKYITGAAQPKLNQAALNSIPIIYPPLEEQQKIVQQLDELQEQTKKLEQIYEQKIKDLDELKQSILQKAFNGEL